MRHATPEHLRFPPIAGYTVRADFEGGAWSSDFGALLLRGIDRQIGLTERLAAAVQELSCRCQHRLATEQFECAHAEQPLDLLDRVAQSRLALVDALPCFRVTT